MRNSILRADAATTPRRGGRHDLEIDPPALSPLASKPWLDAVPSEVMIDAIEDMAARPSLAAAVVTLGTAVFDRPLEESVRQRLVDALAQGVQQWTVERIAIFGQKR